MENEEQNLQEVVNELNTLKSQYNELSQRLNVEQNSEVTGSEAEPEVSEGSTSDPENDENISSSSGNTQQGLEEFQEKLNSVVEQVNTLANVVTSFTNKFEVLETPENIEEKVENDVDEYRQFLRGRE